MKYRVQFSAAFNNTDANAILNTIEGTKSKVFKEISYTQVPIERKTIKEEYIDTFTVPTQYISIDFEGSQITHVTDEGQTYYNVVVDVSFSLPIDYVECVNYLESIKSLADNTKNRFGRHFECMHDEIPLKNDGVYIPVDFDAPPATYSA